MRSNNIKRSMALLIILVAMSSLFLFSVSAATGDLEGLGVTYSGDGTYSHTAGTNTATLSIRASGFWGESKSDTYTFKHPDTASNSVKVSFSYTYSSDSGKTLVKSDNITEKDGVCTITLAPGASFYFTLSSSNSIMQGAKDTSLIISGLTIEPVFDQANVTVLYDNALGRVNEGTANGTKVENGGQVVSTKEAPKTVVATPASGSQFVAWVDPTNNKVLSTNPSYSAVPTASDMTVEAIFATTTPWFFVNNKGNLIKGLTAEDDYTGTIILANNATLPSGNYEIKSGATLLIPYDALGTFSTTPATSTAKTEPKAFRTLEVSDNTTITVKGAMALGGVQSAPGSGDSGNLTGDYGHIILNGTNANIIVEGSLYCHGYITGTGMVHAKTGANVHELFQIRDWRGGSATLNWYGKYKSFVVNEYYIQNIEAKYRVDSGALSHASAAMTITGLGTQQATAVCIGDGGLFQLGDGSFVIREYKPSTDRVYYDLYGSVVTSGINLSVSIYNLDTTDYILAIHHSMTICVKGTGLDGNVLNSNATISKAFKMLPGSELIIEKNATMTIDPGTDLFLYDVNDWKSSYIYAQSGDPAKHQSVAYSPSTRGTRAAHGSARLQVDGTLTAYSNIYTTQNGGTSEDKVLTGTGTFINNKSVSGYSKMTLDEMNNNSSKVTVTNNAVVGILAGVSTSKTDVNDSFGTYTYKGRIDTCTFNGSTLENVNFWYINSKETQPTCADGYTDYYCTDANKAYRVYDVGSGSGNHSWTAATCTTPKTCSVCGATEGNALGHSYGATTYAWSDDGKTCTASRSCSKNTTASCNESAIATVTGSQSKAPTCEAVGETTYTATFTVDWATTQPKTVADIPALDHKWTVAYKWADDGKACTATHVCGNDEKHNETATATVNGVQSKAPTCEDKGETTYTATFDATWATTQTKIVADVDALEHAWGEVTYEWSEDNTTCTAARDCSRNAEHKETETVDSTSEETTAPSCFEKGKTTYTAQFTEDWAGTKTEEVENLDPTGKHVDTDSEGEEGFLECDTEGCPERFAKLVAIDVAADSTMELSMKFLIHKDLVSGITPEVVFGTKTLEKGTGYFTSIEEVEGQMTRYVYTVPVASGEMTKSVTISFENGEKPVYLNQKTDGTWENTASATVAAYARAVLNLTTEMERQRNLVIAMLSYGGYAQAHFSADTVNYPDLAGLLPTDGYFNTEGAYARPSIDGVTAESISQTTKVVDEHNLGFTSSTQEVYLGAAIGQRVYITVPENYAASKYSVSVTFKGFKKDVTIQIDDEGKHYVEILNIPAAYLDEDYLITITEIETEKACTIETSVLAYLKRVLESNNATDSLKALAKAMYLYNQAANEFFGV